MLEILILSAIQGITEFLPISSSAHLVLLSKFFSSDNNLTLELSLHFGSLLAIIFFFKRDIKETVLNKNLFFKIILTSVPISIVGFVLIKTDLLNGLRTLKIIGWTSIVFAILLYLSDLQNFNKNINENLDYKVVFIIGIFQILSIIPGVSRSGVTLTGARYLNFSRIEAAKISFLTSIPILTIASFYNLFSILSKNNFELSVENFIGVLASFLFSYITLKVFLNFLRKFNLSVFVIYRILIGLIILWYVYA